MKVVLIHTARSTVQSLLTLLLLALLFATFTADAEDLSGVVQRSNIIAVVHITSGTVRPIQEIDNGCGYAYEGFVATPIKSSREGEYLSFRATEPLRLSGMYLVFLADSVTDYEDTATYQPAEIDSEKCAAFGIKRTPVEYLEDDSAMGGPELVLESWRLPISGTSDASRVEHFVGSRFLRPLFGDALPHTDIEIPTPHFPLKQTAWDAAKLLNELQGQLNDP